jgi:chromate reductase
MRILAISGSLRGGSYNTSLLDEVAAAIPGTHDWHLLDPSVVTQIPAFSEDDEARHADNPALVTMRAELAAADVVVFATPEYNGSIPGHLKNILDWASRPFDTNPLRNKPVAVLSASDGQFGAVWANNDLRKVLGTLGARVIERQVAIPMAHMQFGVTGTLGNEGLRLQIKELASDIITAATTRRSAASVA